MSNFSVCISVMVEQLKRRKNKKDQLLWWIQYKACSFKKVYSDYRKHRWDMGDKILIFYQYFDNIQFVMLGMFNPNEYESCYIWHV